MTLGELKEPYEELLKACKFDIDKYSSIEIANKYLECKESEKDLYISALICKSWTVLQYLFYKNNTNLLSAEECYDIFIQTLYYVLKMQVWNDENNSLYQDKDGFVKAMSIAAQCRKKNYLHAQHRQKRLVNYNALSLEGIGEDCSDGYFTKYEEKYNLEEDKLSTVIRNYFKKKDYVTAFVLEGILNFNLYTIETDFDIRKLRKYLRHINDSFCKLFSFKYNVSLEEVLHSRIYFEGLTQEKLDESIDKSISKLKNNKTIRQMVKVC